MYKLILGILILLFVGCISNREVFIAYSPASEYKYIANSTDSIIINAFQNNDTLTLKQRHSLIQFYCKDSLFFGNEDTIKKLFANYFDIYVFQNNISNYYIFRYDYSFNLIFIKSLYNNELQFEKININDTIYLRNLKTINDF